MDLEKQLVISARIPKHYHEGDSLFNEYKISFVKFMEENGFEDYEIRIVKDLKHPGWNFMEAWA